MKIALVSCYFIDNYGSILQSYATQKVFRSFGAECDTVAAEKLLPGLRKAKARYYCRNLWRVGLLRSKLPKFWLAVMQKTGFRQMNVIAKQRHERFDAFRSRLQYTRACDSFGALGLLSKEYDAVVLGSDQLWRPDNIFPGYYTLEWVAPKVKRMALATSFGVSQLDRASRKRAEAFLPEFASISVREPEGAAIVQALTGKEAAVVCDPVLLLSSAEWKTLADTSLCPNEDYIFTYFLGTEKRNRTFAWALAAETGLPIVSVPFVDCYRKEDTRADYCFPACSPEQFLGLLMNAKYVCTDSFHASAFSVLFEKQFFAFCRFHAKSGNTNGRVLAFLRQLRLQRQEIANGAFTPECLRPIDYGPVRCELESMRQQTFDFLKQEILCKPEVRER